MFCGNDALSFRDEFLVELLTGPDAGRDDLDVFVRLFSGKRD